MFSSLKSIKSHLRLIASVSISVIACLAIAYSYTSAMTSLLPGNSPTIGLNVEGSAVINNTNGASTDNALDIKLGRLLVENGNVGIGTVSPDGTLDVMKTISGLTTGLRFSSWHTPSVSAGGIIDSYDDGGIVRNLVLQNNGGNVGIGTTGPSNKLHVAGAIGATDWVGAGCEGACESGGGYSLMFANGNIVHTGNLTTSGRAIISGGANINGRLTIGEAGGAYTYITLLDDESSNGVKYIHANSNIAGFLNGSGGWMAYWDPAGNMQNIGSATILGSATIYGRASLGSTGANYVGAWNNNLQLNGDAWTSISFHDAGASVHSIQHIGSSFYIGQNVGWGAATINLAGTASGADGYVRGATWGFGGIFTLHAINGCTPWDKAVVNPYTSSCSCPTGFTPHYFGYGEYQTFWQCLR